MKTLQVSLGRMRASPKYSPPGASRNTSNRFRGLCHTGARIPTAPNLKLQEIQTRCWYSSTANTKVENRVYDPVRRPDELATYILATTSSRAPLITLWTTSWCPSCRVIEPLINFLISSGVGESEGGVAFCEVELDSQEVIDSGLGVQYMITSIPTLLTFDRGEVVSESRAMDATMLKDKNRLKEWIEVEARRRGYGTGGAGGLGSGLFGGLFGDRR